jgi:hypothetical protein
MSFIRQNIHDIYVSILKTIITFAPNFMTYLSLVIMYNKLKKEIFMKKVSLFLVSLVAVVALCVGFSSCGGGSSGGKKITNKEEAFTYLKGKMFSGSNSTGSYFRVDFDSSNKTCEVRFAMPGRRGWVRVGETFTYEIRDNLDVVMRDKVGSYTFNIPTLTFETWSDGDFKMKEGNHLP